MEGEQKQENNHSFFNREDAKKAGAENQGVAALKIKAKITNKIKAKIFVSILRNRVSSESHNARINGRVAFEVDEVNEVTTRYKI